jgi:NAD(P)-dependent dehydrogenase (short-subunit alcohol dehydrogenase family)
MLTATHHLLLAEQRQAVSEAVGLPVLLTAYPGLIRHDALLEAIGPAAGRTCGAVWVEGAGVCAFGRSAAELQMVATTYRATAVRGEGADQLRRRLDRVAEGAGAGELFAGEVVLITGAASGIGRACVDAFLERGAAVVGLDINPAIVDLSEAPAYLGLACDAADEAAVVDALGQVVQTFGGLDMLVLNAGVFPAGCDIAALELAEWRRVMRINLDAGLIMLRHAHPLLKLAPRGGRVAVNGSRNVLAPGPGAAAYSCSKAALTQLARVAALEWGTDGIRVNVFHAHGVFDTGIWTDEVLAARARHYGKTVEEYKRNNLLKTEVTSRDVAELAAAMCGPLFAKTTGAQVPIDGGSDRVV